MGFNITEKTTAEGWGQWGMGAEEEAGLGVHLGSVPGSWRPCVPLSSLHKMQGEHHEHLHSDPHCLRGAGDVSPGCTSSWGDTFQLAPDSPFHGAAVALAP